MRLLTAGLIKRAKLVTVERKRALSTARSVTKKLLAHGFDEYVARPL
jgi:hypothetical protein